MSRRKFERAPARLDVGQKVIIVCEGSKTEPGYFKAIRVHWKLSKDRVMVCHANATNPRKIVEFARDEVQRLEDNGDWNKEEDCVWAVYDGVEHYNHNKKDWDEALDLARTNHIHLAVTNPSFEFWYLLHFQEQTAMLHRDAAYARLKENWVKTTKKGMCCIPSRSKNTPAQPSSGRTGWLNTRRTIISNCMNILAPKA